MNGKTSHRGGDRVARLERRVQGLTILCAALLGAILTLGFAGQNSEPSQQYSMVINPNRGSSGQAYILDHRTGDIITLALSSGALVEKMANIRMSKEN